MNKVCALQIDPAPPDFARNQTWVVQYPDQDRFERSSVDRQRGSDTRLHFQQ